ncbi:MAG: AMP-binding protein, partial [Myxococcota bacterium]
MIALSSTLSGLLEETKLHHPQQCFYFQPTERQLTIHALHSAQEYFGAHAIQHGIMPGDRVGILFDNSPEFLIAFFGLARARAAAVSLPLPASMRDLQGHYVERLTRILTKAQVSVIVASEMFAPLIQNTLNDVKKIRVLTVGEFSDPIDTSTLPTPKLDDLAFVQFTSGSSAAPKGACLTHSNIVTNLRAIRTAARLSERDRLHMWLPFFHDMGIFGTLALMISGATIEVSAPSSFVKAPERWLARFCEKKATVYVG